MSTTACCTIQMTPATYFLRCVSTCYNCYKTTKLRNSSLTGGGMVFPTLCCTIQMIPATNFWEFCALHFRQCIASVSKPGLFHVHQHFLYLVSTLWRIFSVSIHEYTWNMQNRRLVGQQLKQVDSHLYLSKISSSCAPNAPFDITHFENHLQFCAKENILG